MGEYLINPKDQTGQHKEKKPADDERTNKCSQRRQSVIRLCIRYGVTGRRRANCNRDGLPPCAETDC